MLNVVTIVPLKIFTIIGQGFPLWERLGGSPTLLTKILTNSPSLKFYLLIAVSLHSL